MTPDAINTWTTSIHAKYTTFAFRNINSSLLTFKADTTEVLAVIDATSPTTFLYTSIKFYSIKFPSFEIPTIYTFDVELRSNVAADALIINEIFTSKFAVLTRRYAYITLHKTFDIL